MLRYRVKRQIQTTARAKTETKKEKKNMQIRTLFRSFCPFLCTIYRYKISP